MRHRRSAGEYNGGGGFWCGNLEVGEVDWVNWVNRVPFISVDVRSSSSKFSSMIGSLRTVLGLAVGEF